MTTEMVMRRLSRQHKAEGYDVQTKQAATTLLVFSFSFLFYFSIVF